ncbi:replication-associated recombination protein A [Lawsonia intracellularis]|uniref:Replication-associated recombination protein A n=1 Tax=Lawsonia intracellularis (strain PHE/MN1-00) TaxID=363253 RepID=Q1MSF5_LAWIP|nr:replication-associated recombination protein A [Lawsonia intracellularis]AGC49414.1 recombination factor protein RarA [Lawsonia intracellularis N343]KAA0204930.1 replication-associated recombination protein A [Lawsonia intracellularis]MBZ3893178.1 replication-associated recombination protein A [Lawsonia intracellularis]OMQ06076.1 recombinase RarA [Lawsonia intracellularis]RBN32521.1 replication-associated recombination protein A [Lawsonia intracellularis]
MSLTPLSEKLRPNNLDTFIGQNHLLERLQYIISAPRLPSLLFFGPPGCGKSTLALLLAYKKSTNILRISAPETGIQQLRQKLTDIDILILDEIHRFSKAQQDFFLPLLESGKLTMLATTTENPSFSVTKQLLSRLNVLQLRQLGYNELKELVKKGTLFLNILLPDDVINFLATTAHGDARTLFNLIEYISILPEEKRVLEYIKINLPEILERHDKDGDSHYEYASALIKSIRGSNPDAALYYLACLLEGGEDPRFICRRLIISASEDIGLADPQALSLAVSCQQAVEFVGMPEGFIPLSETVVYLALARKSNSTYAAYSNAAREVRLHGAQPVPLHLRNPSTQLQKQWGYGREYKYPHNYPNAWVEQEYFPSTISNRSFYYPKEQGEEPKLNMWHNHIKKKYSIPEESPK